MTPRTKRAIVQDGVKCFFEFCILCGLFAMYGWAEKGIFTCGAGWMAAVFVAGGSFILLVRFRIQEDRQLQKRALKMQRYKEE